MADAYANSSLAANSTTLIPANAVGSEMLVAINVYESAVGDANADVVRIFKALPASIVIHKIEFDHDSIANGTDWDLGLYETDLGAVVNADVFVDGDDLSTGAKNVDGMQTLNIDARNKPLYEQAGHTNITKKNSYDLAWTLNAAGDGGTVVTRLYYTKS